MYVRKKTVQDIASSRDIEVNSNQASKRIHCCCALGTAPSPGGLARRSSLTSTPRLLPPLTLKASQPRPQIELLALSPLQLLSARLPPLFVFLILARLCVNHRL